MLFCTAAVSLLVLATPVKTNYHNVAAFDNLINVSQRVLDRTICKDVQRAQPIDNSSWATLTQDQKDARVRQMEIKQKRNINEMETHCRNRLRGADIKSDTDECSTGTF